MKRRGFIKSMGALGLVSSVPSFFQNDYFIKKASAASRILDANVNLSGVTQLPQVINIFLYGGPSELAGNLSNINDINMNSQNSYPDRLLEVDGSGVTANKFWGSRTIGQVNNVDEYIDQGAGGYIMEDMLRTQDMSVYRTINRTTNNTRAHRPSVFSSLKGNLDIEMSGGVGSTLAGVLLENSAQVEAVIGKPLDDLLLPFVSFEGSSTAFAPDANYTINSTQFKGISLDTNFANPFTRATGIAGTAGDPNGTLDMLVNSMSGNSSSRFKGVDDAFVNRKTLEEKLDTVSEIVMPAVTGAEDRGLNDQYVDDSGNLKYPPRRNNRDNRYTSRIRAAVSLAINNPDSLYITVGGGLGGWDDHDNSITSYEERMCELMDTMRAAMKQIRYSHNVPLNGSVPRPTDNIIINIHGDFGRNVNLNNSQGWDHGNNQNMYTFGGAAFRPAGALGKVVGQTERFGDSGQNRQFTRPTSTSYQAEPMSIAASVYAYFGVVNPEVLTADADMNPSGSAKIDESQAASAAAPVFVNQDPTV